jgi:hypothetical protein
MDQFSFDMLSSARAYVGAGISVISIKNGSKEPASPLLPHIYNPETGLKG